MLVSDLGHRRYWTLEKDDTESRSGGKAESIFYSLTPLPRRDHIHPEEEALTPEIGRGNSLVEGQMVSDTGCTLSVWGTLCGVGCTQVCWRWLQIKGISSFLKSDRCNLEQATVLTNGRHSLHLSCWSISGFLTQNPDRSFCGNSYPSGPYPDMVTEVTIICVTKPVSLGWASHTFPPPLSMSLIIM